MALRGMSQANMDLGILQETKLTDGIYTRGSFGYSVIATDAPSRHRGGVALFYRSEPHFMVEAVEKFGPNVLDFQLATGARRWYIVPKLLHRLHHELWFGAVEKCDAAAVSARRIRRDDAIAKRPAGVDPIREFCLLEDSHIHVSLGHPPECHL